MFVRVFVRARVLEQSRFLIVDQQHRDLSRPLDCVDAICQPQSHGVLQGFCVIVHVNNLHACRGGVGAGREGGRSVHEVLLFTVFS